jgi:hypothetical protein
MWAGRRDAWPLAGLIVTTSLAAPRPASSCECAWAGPFFAVAPLAESIVRGRVLAHVGIASRIGAPPAMDIEVLEVVAGARRHGPLRVWGGDGNLCRPAVSEFPIGSEWLLALNGPGAKPAMSPGPSLSLCGEYAVRVEDGEASGAIEPGATRGTRQRMPLDTLRTGLRTALAAAGWPRGAARSSFAGEVKAGESFTRRFGLDLTFRLEPRPHGWEITVRQAGRDENLARLTPPFHFVPNPRDIEGWHFRNADNTAANDGSVNAPGSVRGFVFSPEVGRSIQGPTAVAAVTAEEVEAVRRFGTGVLRIVDFRLDHLAPGERAAFAWLRFEVELTWNEDALAVDVEAVPSRR